MESGLPDRLQDCSDRRCESHDGFRRRCGVLLCRRAIYDVGESSNRGNTTARGADVDCPRTRAQVACVCRVFVQCAWGLRMKLGGLAGDAVTEDLGSQARRIRCTGAIKRHPDGLFYYIYAHCIYQAVLYWLWGG